VAIGSLDGRDAVAYTCAADPAGRIWFADTGTTIQLGTISGHEQDFLYSITIGNFDGQDIVVGGWKNGSVSVWDSAGQPVGHDLDETADSTFVSTVAVGKWGGQDVIVSAGLRDTLVSNPDGQRVGPTLDEGTGHQTSASIGQLHGQDVIVVAKYNIQIIGVDGHLIGEPLVHGVGGITRAVIGKMNNQDVIVSAFAEDSTVRIWHL
jgi:WD40 repeat protein